MEMKIEWVSANEIAENAIDIAAYGEQPKPVVRLDTVDALIAGAVKVMEVCAAVGEIHFKTCALSAGAHDQLKAFLTSDLVAQWRKRQEEGKKS